MADELDGHVAPSEYGGYADVTVDITDKANPLLIAWSAEGCLSEPYQ